MLSGFQRGDGRRDVRVVRRRDDNRVQMTLVAIDAIR